jgi:hypothetical protein
LKHIFEKRYLKNKTTQSKLFFIGRERSSIYDVVFVNGKLFREKEIRNMASRMKKLFFWNIFFKKEIQNINLCIVDLLFREYHLKKYIQNIVLLLGNFSGTYFSKDKSKILYYELNCKTIIWKIFYEKEVQNITIRMVFL